LIWPAELILELHSALSHDIGLFFVAFCFRRARRASPTEASIVRGWLRTRTIARTSQIAARRTAACWHKESKRDQRRAKRREPKDQDQSRKPHQLLFRGSM